MSTLYYYNTNTSAWTPVVVGKAGPPGPPGPEGPEGPQAVIEFGDTPPLSPEVGDLWIDTSS